MTESLLAIKAEEILRKIEDGKPVEYENVIIFGDLDLYRIDLPEDEGGRKVISSIIKIEYSVIKGDVFFDRAIFRGLVDFDGTVFTKTANFSDSHFSEDAGFSEAEFHGDPSFLRARFSGEANFSRARFGGSADFGSSVFERNLFLENAKIYTMRLQGASFPTGSNIYMKDLDFSRITVRWESVREHIPFNGSAYLALVKNFKILEQFEDADACYYCYRREKQSRQTSFRARLLDSLAWISCGYGVRPGNTVALSIVIILVFTGIFWSGGALSFDAESGIGVSSSEDGSQLQIGVSAKDAFYFSCMEFMGKTPQNLNVDRSFAPLTVVESLVGWVLMALFLVTLGKVMLR